MKFMARIRAFFLKEEGGKEVLNQKKFFGVMILIFVIGALVIFYSNMSGDSSVVVNARAPIEAGDVAETKGAIPALLHNSIFG